MQHGPLGLSHASRVIVITGALGGVGRALAETSLAIYPRVNNRTLIL